MILTFLCFDETFPNIKRDVGCAIQNDVCYGSPSIGRELFKRRNEISCSIVDHHLSVKAYTGFMQVQDWPVFNTFASKKFQLMDL